MDFARKSSMKIFLTGFILLTFSIAIFFLLSYRSTVKYLMKDSEFYTNELSNELNVFLIEKVKQAKIILTSQCVLEALQASNQYYQTKSEKLREEEISVKDEKWRSINDVTDPFILKYTDNKVSGYFKDLQSQIKGEYGEIFLTNKFGALVSSTSKLTTFAHGHKYWWKGAYNNGNATVFLDDRGYDDSVDGYVLGIVVPVQHDNEIIGIIKVNLNILGSLSKILTNFQIRGHENLKLIRSGGLIVFKDGVEPLSREIDKALKDKIHSGSYNSSYIYSDKKTKYIVGLSEIEISSNMEGYKFGGSFESIDHKSGNKGESWLILDMNPFKNAIIETTSLATSFFVVGFILMIFLAIISYFMGKQTVKPLNELIEQTKHISIGDFDAFINCERNDEFGVLASEFNRMAGYLKESTTSILKLNAINRQLSESEEMFRSYIENAPVGIFVADNLLNFVEVNQSASIITGYSKEELLSLTLADLIKDNFREMIDDKLINLSLNESHRDELGFVTKTGESRIFDFNIVKLSSAQYLCFVKDITEMKEAEREVEKYQKNLENLVEERTEKLEKQNSDLIHMNQLFVGREFRIKELRTEIEQLKNEIESLKQS